MKILAILLAIISASKLLTSASIKTNTLSNMPNPTTFDRDTLLNIIRGMIVADGLIGLFCAGFILFML